MGRYADGWLTRGVGAREYAEKRDQVRRSAASAGRSAPINALSPLILLGDSHAHAAASLRAQPLANLILLFAPATLWKQYGLDHPSGPRCRGYPDTIPHAVNPALLRELARKIPLEMFEEFVMMGNAEDVEARLRPFAEAGLEHVVLADLTGFTFSMEETSRLLTTPLGPLKRLLSKEAL